MKNLFKKFLVEHGVFEAWCAKADLDSIRYTIRTKSYSTLIVDAFYWHNTPEGVEFWKDIDNKWRKYLLLSDCDKKYDNLWK